jgi:hypothetical protein
VVGVTYRTIIVLSAVSLLVFAAGCGSAPSGVTARAPDVTMEPLNAAEDELDARNLAYDVLGGGLFGVVVRSHWTVCKQIPAAGRRTGHVTLYVARDCGEEDWR